LTPHSRLVALAAAWLRKRKLCSVVVTELTHSGPESADAIGFRMGLSWLCECKASRADFLADKKKHFRRYPASGMGTRRFYVCDDGVIEPVDLPEGWGLLVLRDGFLNELRDSEIHECDHRRELELMTSCLRRMLCQPSVRAIRCKTYVWDEGGEPRATIWAETTKAEVV
jgi:hypothetical protein